ncbi:hypothetical protein [Mesorhizobium sp. M0217]|uniref:hypothetical protein n=1 Tax=unclassified Mesorhizobium TaxID=325217 RepID=UPI00333658B7
MAEPEDRDIRESRRILRDIKQQNGPAGFSRLPYGDRLLSLSEKYPDQIVRYWPVGLIVVFGLLALLIYFA